MHSDHLCLSVVIGKAFGPRYVRRLICFLGLIVFILKKLSKKVARKGSKIAQEFRSFKGQKEFFESVR